MAATRPGAQAAFRAGSRPNAPHNDGMNLDDTAADRSNRRFAAFCLLVTLALLLCRLPYRGVRHDGILYLAQALARLNPSWAASDFYFAFGSQDRYSLFSLPRAWLLQWASTPIVDIATILLAWGASVWALVALAHALSPRLRWLGVMTVIVASHFYGSGRIFSFLEPFLTARTLAEPLALAALALLLRGRRVLAVVALAGSLLFHPLVGLPMAVVLFFHQVGRDRRWAWLSMLLLPIAGLAVAGVAPFSALLRTYDENWWSAVLQANGAVVIGKWHQADFVAALANLGVLALSVRGRQDALARAGRAALVAAPVLCVVSYVAVDLLHDVLITQLQLWRVLWLVNVLALLNLAPLLAREWARGPAGRLAAVAVFVAYFVADCYSANGWVIVAWAIVAVAVSARGIALKPSVVIAASVATLIVGVGATALQVFNALGQLNLEQQGMAIARTWSIPFALPIVMLPLALGLILVWERGDVARASGVAAAAALLTLGVLTWDQRGPWERHVEAAQPGSHPFAKLIPPGAEVYWHEDVLATWLLLQRAQFISLNQVSGLLFNRDTAYVASTRLPYLVAVKRDAQACTTLSRLGADTRQLSMCQLSRDAFLGMCRAEPTHPDFLVAAVDFGTGVVARWPFVPDDGSAPVTYVLYDCSKIR